MTVIEGDAKSLYPTLPRSGPRGCVAIPYYAYANRGPVEMAVWLPETRPLAVATSLAAQAMPSASHFFPADALVALNNQAKPSKSDDESIPRFTWWDHRGTKEWVQYDFDKPTRVSAVEVYWFDERRHESPLSRAAILAVVVQRRRPNGNRSRTPRPTAPPWTATIG